MEGNLQTKSGEEVEVFPQPLSTFTFEEESKIKEEFVEQKDIWNGSEESDREEDGYG